MSNGCSPFGFYDNKHKHHSASIMMCQAHTSHHEADSYFVNRHEGELRRSSLLKPDPGDLSDKSGGNNFPLICWSIITMKELN